jgi:hypothetical protein
MEWRHWFVFSALFLRGILEVGYRDFVNPIFAYSGFIWEPSIVKYLESWVIYLSLVFILSAKLRKPSDFLMANLLFGLLAPMFVFYAFTDAPREHLYIILLGYLLIQVFRSGATLRLPYVNSSRPLALYILVIGAFVVTLWMIASGGLQYFNLDLRLVYDFRRDVGAVISQGPMGYLNTWATKVFGPALLAIALWKKRYFLALSVFGLHVIWFGISSHKAVLFYPFLITFLWVWFRSTKALSLIPIGMGLAVSISYLLFLFIDEIFVGSLFIRRVFFVPANNIFFYYEFFSQNPFVYWSNSITSSFINYPYHINPARLIGEARGTESHVNNSFLSTGYMHAGLAGVIFYGVLAGLIFRLIDSISASGIPAWLAIAIIIVPSRSLLISADLPTSLLTHGIGIAIVILFLMRISPRREAQKRRNNYTPAMSGTSER